MQFLILATDATDNDAPSRRMENREEHLACIARYKERGHMKMGAAILDDNGKMTGSVLVADFPSRRELDNWLTEDPYVTQKVWDDIRVSPCKIAPAFANL